MARRRRRKNYLVTSRRDFGYPRRTRRRVPCTATRRIPTLRPARMEKLEDSPQTITLIGEQSVICKNLVATSPLRLTPTGKISHAKTRVYTQRYRKEWEQMSDFKGTRRRLLSLSSLFSPLSFAPFTGSSA